MKSSAHKALASLQHRHHALIRQHGALKNELKAARSELVVNTVVYGGAKTGRVSAAIPSNVLATNYNSVEKRVASIFLEQLLKDNIAELETTIERLEFDLRAARNAGGPNTAFKEDVLLARKHVRQAQNDAQKARSDRDDAKQAVWIYSLLSFVVGVAGTYGTLFAYGLVPGIY